MSVAGEICVTVSISSFHRVGSKLYNFFLFFCMNLCTFFSLFNLKLIFGHLLGTR